MDSALAFYAGGQGLIPVVGRKLSIQLVILTLGCRSQETQKIGPSHVEMVFKCGQ